MFVLCVVLLVYVVGLRVFVLPCCDSGFMCVLFLCVLTCCVIELFVCCVAVFYCYVIFQ